jgi:3-oxoacyl-[acyl-carrier protein] reductase
VGKATALALAARHLDVALVGRPSANLEAVAATCRTFGGSAHIVACDLSDPLQIEYAGVQLAALGPVRTLVNNAGVATRATLEELTLASYSAQMNTNLLAPIWLTRALLPSLKRETKGTIINVASISSTLGTAGQIVYNASKWAVLGFTKSLACELTNSGLMTVAVLPGSIDTDMLVGSGFEARMTPADVAQTLVHYALDAPLAHNGATIEMFGV